MAPIVVKFEDKYNPKDVKVSKDDQRALKSGKPISIEQIRAKRKVSAKEKIRKAKTEEEAVNLQNDLALDRLLEESHILSSQRRKAQYSGAELTLKGENSLVGTSRVRALDSRMKKLSKQNRSAPKKLENMSMTLRKGLIRGHMERVAKYEEEAKNSGTVLAKARKGEFRRFDDDGVTSFTDRIGTGHFKKSQLRDRGLKVNSVGRAATYGITLTEKDVEKIVGPARKKRTKGSGRYYHGHKH